MLNKFKLIAQIIGFATILLLATQGALTLLTGQPIFAAKNPPAIAPNPSAPNQTFRALLQP